MIPRFNQCRITVPFFTASCVLWGAAELLSEDPRPARLSAGAMRELPNHESGKLQEIVTGLIRDSIPEHYVDDKRWDQKKRIYAGVKVWRDGWRLETKRRWKEVNHGLWSRYQIDLVDPQEKLEIQLQDLSWLSDGTAQYEIVVTATARCRARRSRWNYGVRLWSISVDAVARLSITITGTIGMQLDLGKVPPDVVFTPEVLKADIGVETFEVDRISKIGGDVAEGIGDALESILKEQIVERQQDKLVDRMNRQIERRKDRLRLSMSDWLTKLLDSAADQSVP